MNELPGPARAERVGPVDREDPDMPPEEGPAEWRPGCPDCAHLREELATVRAEMRAAVVAYEARLRVQGEYHVALVDGLRHVLDAASDPMDVYGVVGLGAPVEPRP